MTRRNETTKGEMTMKSDRYTPETAGVVLRQVSQEEIDAANERDSRRLTREMQRKGESLVWDARLDAYVVVTK